MASENRDVVDKQKEEIIDFEDSQNQLVITPKVKSVKAKKAVYDLYWKEFNTDDLDSKYLRKIRDSKHDVKINIRISSFGGELYALFNVFNYIIHSGKTNVNTYLDPMGFSAGAYLFMVGKKRIIYPNSTIMFHNVRVDLPHDDIDSHSDYLEFIKKLQDNELHTLVAPYLTKHELKKFNQGIDLYYTAIDMLKKGIATHIMYKGELLSYKEYKAIIKNK